MHWLIEWHIWLKTAQTHTHTRSMLTHQCYDLSLQWSSKLWANEINTPNGSKRFIQFCRVQWDIQNSSTCHEKIKKKIINVRYARTLISNSIRLIQTSNGLKCNHNNFIKMISQLYVRIEREHTQTVQNYCASHLFVLDFGNEIQQYCVRPPNTLQSTTSTKKKTCQKQAHCPSFTLSAVAASIVTVIIDASPK